MQKFTETANTANSRKYKHLIQKWTYDGTIKI